MGKKIIVAGAGHGGLGAAAILSSRGYDVTIIEQKQRDELGYDWYDCTLAENFDAVGAGRPDEDSLHPMKEIYYFSPAKTVLVKPYKRIFKKAVYIERKLIYDLLIENAEKNGVKIIYGVKILSAVCDDERVTGILTQNGEMKCDFVIDAAGMDSPVRRSLPEKFGILREIDDADTLFTFRAFYRNNGAFSALPKYCAYFYHCGHRGFDWVINEGDYSDVLVGALGKLDEDDVEKTLEDFRSDHKYLTDEILRGGQYGKIPLRKTLSKLVCNSYAVIGDSASMIEPLSGSGITLSLNSAPMLADAVCEAENGGYCEKDLWQYQYDYFNKYIKMILHDDALKSLLTEIGEENLNKLFTKKILSAKDLYGGKMSIPEFIDKASGMISAPGLVPYFTKLAVRLKKIDVLYKTIPEKYDEAAAAEWINKYDSF